jgi:3-methyladenine DNA glycosylase AlkD
MEIICSLIERVQQTKAGFTDIRKTTHELVETTEVLKLLEIADELFKSDIAQARMLATFIHGELAAKHLESLEFLKETASHDPDWRVQEILVQAFDCYCANRGYENALSTIKEWLSDPHHNVRRAVSEGLRIWTARPYFKHHPEVTIQLLSQLKADDSKYVRKSAGNALRDITRKYAALVRVELENWDLHKRIAYTYKLASKFLLER